MWVKSQVIVLNAKIKKPRHNLMDSVFICPDLGMLSIYNFQSIIPPPSCRISSLLKSKYAALEFSFPYHWHLSASRSFSHFHFILWHLLHHHLPYLNSYCHTERFHCPCKGSQTLVLWVFDYNFSNKLSIAGASSSDCTMDLANLSVNMY